MPHRNINYLNKLSESITMVNNGKPKHIIPVGDFNCPDIDWNNMTINPKAAEKEVQKKLIDLSTEFNHQSTRHTNQRRQLVRYSVNNQCNTDEIINKHTRIFRP